MPKDYTLGSTVIMKKNHACGSNLWAVIRIGVDVKIKCISCSREVMLDRLKFEKRLKKVVKKIDE